MFCPKCGTQIPESSQVCNSCGFSIVGTPAAAQTATIAQTSGWAIAALICGIFSPSGIMAIPAIIFGIIALVKINKSKGAFKGKGLAITGIILPFVLIPMISILIQALSQPGILSPEVVCRSHLYGLGGAMFFYADEHENKYPAADKWCDLLIEDADVSQKSFCCRGAPNGPCNYAINKNVSRLSPSNMVLLFEASPGWNQVGGPEILTTENHKGEGCNILFNDGRVEFIKTEDLDKLLWEVKDKTPK